MTVNSRGCQADDDSSRPVDKPKRIVPLVHPPHAVDCPNEPHIDDDGACICCADCCCDPVTDLCSCPACGGRAAGCPDHIETSPSRGVTTVDGAE